MSSDILPPDLLQQIVVLPADVCSALIECDACGKLRKACMVI